MKFKVLIITLLALSSNPLVAMAPSWAANIYDSTRKKWLSVCRMINFSFMHNYQAACKRQPAFYNEIEEIIHNGSTVQETETKKIRAKHEQVLDDFKKCGCISDQDWINFLNESELLKQKNRLFKLPFFFGKAAPPDMSGTQTESKISDNHIIEKAIRKLHQRNLNPRHVSIVIDKNLKVTGQANQSKDGNSTTNSISLNASHCTAQELEFVIDHEITHLQEHHTIERGLLNNLNSSASCLTPLFHQQEDEADTLFALQDVIAARNGVSYFCKTQRPSRFKSTDLHPATFKRCLQLQRIVAKLELEKELREKKLLRKLGDTPNPAFDTASNS